MQGHRFANDLKQPPDGTTMNRMGKHSDGTAPAPARHARDHLWVLAVIAAACGLEVCATWTGIGARSGFPVIRLPYGIARVPTDFCLMVCMEAYAYYALCIWLTRPGRRSGPFAMWSAIGAMVLSLTGQVADHVTGANVVPPRWLIGFVSALPVVALFLGAILAHFVRTDREEAEAAGRQAAEAARLAAEEAAAADERTALRAELDAAREALGTAQADRDAARQEAAQIAANAARDTAQAAAKIEALTRKLAAQKAARDRTKAPGADRGKAPHADDGTSLPADFDARTQALELYLANPQISGRELGEAVGMKERWGQLRKVEFAAAAPKDPEE